MSDPKQLLEQYCRQSDTSAFTAFYRQQADRLWRFLRARGCSEDTAYELVSESFLKFTQVVCKDLQAPLALLYRIAINLHIDNYRRVQASPVEYQPDEQLEHYAVNPLESADIQVYVRTLIKKLSEGEQNLLLLRYWVGLTHKEIAVSLQVPEGTVRRQCAEALNKLKQYWQDQ